MIRRLYFSVMHHFAVYCYPEKYYTGEMKCFSKMQCFALLHHYLVGFHFIFFITRGLLLLKGNRCISRVVLGKKCLILREFLTFHEI